MSDPQKRKVRSSGVKSLSVLIPDQWFSQPALCTPEAAELMSQCVISSDSQHASHHAPFTQAARLSALNSPPDCRNKDERHVSTHSGEQEQAETRAGWRWTSLDLPAAHGQVPQWLTGLSVQHPPLHGDKVVAECCQDVRAASQATLDFSFSSALCFSCHTGQTADPCEVCRSRHINTDRSQSSPLPASPHHSSLCL